MKVALVCPTVGQTKRGYERFITDLFQLLSGDVDLTLFKGAGEAGPGEVVVRHLSRTGALAKLARQRLRYSRYLLEYATFAVSLWPHLARGAFDLVHFIDPPLGRQLAALRRMSRKRHSLLFTNAGPTSFDASRFVDHTHCLTPAALEESLAAGIPEQRITMLPVGVSESDAGASDRTTLRRSEGIAPGTFVILAVAALNRHHKRIDYLIEEVAKLEGDVLLWIDGSLHPDGDPTLIELAERLLPGRYRHTHVASDRVVDLYHCADVLVSAAVSESFGMAIVEAMVAGLPVVAHDAPHFRWLVGQSGHLVDMTIEGRLAGSLERWRRDSDDLRGGADPGEVVGRFGWAALEAGYLDLYRRVAVC